MNNLKVADLSIEEFKTLMREIVFETLQDMLSKEHILEVDDGEQQELEAMFGKSPQLEEFVSERTIEL
jgi:hypothetical protein